MRADNGSAQANVKMAIIATTLGNEIIVNNIEIAYGKAADSCNCSSARKRYCEAILKNPADSG